MSGATAGGSGSRDITASSPAHLTSLEEIRQAQRQFALDRDWQQFHTPRNLLMAMVGEVGELAEIFQWKGEVSPGLPELSAEERVHVGEEISDVLLYLVRLADVCGVDLGRAVSDKVLKNAAKYPADRCRGSAAKYSSLPQEGVCPDGPRPTVQGTTADSLPETAIETQVQAPVGDSLTAGPL